MNTRTLASLALAGALLLPALAGPRPPRSAANELTDKVSLFVAGSAEPMKDASRVVVWLVPADLAAVPAPEPGRYRMLQHNKMFEPDFLVVPLGSVVDFPNLDPWFHNVFSLYRGKRFDLGLYEAGAEKAVTFDRPGPSFLFCNIHPQMTAVIMAVDSNFFGVSDKTGELSIANVPPGKYVLHAWHEDAAPETIQALQRPLTITSADTALPAINIQVMKRDSHHKDMYGRDYDTAAPSY